MGPPTYAGQNIGQTYYFRPHRSKHRSKVLGRPILVLTCFYLNLIESGLDNLILWYLKENSRGD